MAINWAKVRQAMTQTPNYNPDVRGGGASYRTTVGPKTGTPYRGSGYGANQYNWGNTFSSRPNAGGGADYMSTIGNVNRPTTAAKSNPNAFANARAAMTSPAAYGDEEEGGIMEVIKQKSGEAFNDAKTMGSNFATPMMAAGKKVLEGIGGMSEGIGRGIRLHNAYKDKYGNSDQYNSDKKAMMTGKDKAFYDKYMNLADMATDNQKAQEYRDIADTAWRNQQTTDRLAFANQFEDYSPGKYTGQGEGSRYTGGRKEGNLVPGYDRMTEIINRNFIPNPNAAPQGIQYEDPDMLNEILPGEPGVDLRPYAGMQSGIDYDAMGLAPDPENDLLYGEPGFGGSDIVPKIKPEPYNPYRDEDYGAPLRDIDMYEGIYESPLTDTLYGEELVSDSVNPRLRNNPAFMRPRDTVAIESMGGGMNAFDRRTPGPFEYLPFYSGFGDLNFSPELEEEDVVLGDGSIVNSRLDLYN
jgi:hypothetical protein